jgi:hypothetical protein
VSADGRLFVGYREKTMSSVGPLVSMLPGVVPAAQVPESLEAARSVGLGAALNPIAKTGLFSSLGDRQLAAALSTPRPLAAPPTA